MPDNPTLFTKQVGVAFAVVLLLPVFAHFALVAAPSTGSYVVLTSSMSPTIDAGDVVYVVPSGDYAVGDVVTFTREGTTVTHRIVEETESGFVTKGDANNAADGQPVPESAIVGSVVASVPFYGHALAFASSPLGMLLFIGVPGLLLAAHEVVGLLRAE